jgi:ParB family chromosome partitioning protein
VVVDVAGVGHALHETRTDAATRGLIRALADDPGTALVALVARLFTTLVLETARPLEQSALAITANGYGRRGQDPIESLDGDVRRRLAERRADYRACGLRPIAWVAALAHGERMALLAELVAITVDVREARTTSLRSSARADAAEIAALASADIADHWTPDEPFLRAHSKAQLLAMLEAMGAPDERARALKKDELVTLLAERAAEHGWAPPSLNFSQTAESLLPDAEGAEGETSVADGVDRPEDEACLVRRRLVRG